MRSPRLHEEAGIAIGPILFVLALLGVLASVLSSGVGGSFGRAGQADRVTTDIVGQANLIRNKILECEMQYELKGDSYASGACAGDPYPCSDTTNGTLVESLTCPNDPLVSGAERSIWTGLRVTSLPPPTQGFSKWMYINGGVSGRCIWTAPTSGKSNASAVEGLGRAATKFTSQELQYDPASNGQKFVVIITPPTSGSLNSNCQSN